MGLFKSSSSGATSPAPEPTAVELTEAGMQALVWQSRAVEAHRIARDALARYGSHTVPSDVLLDVMNAVVPPKPLRPAVPVIPGRA